MNLEVLHPQKEFLFGGLRELLAFRFQPFHKDSGHTIFHPHPQCLWGGDEANNGW